MKRFGKALKPKALMGSGCPFMVYQKLTIILIVFIFVIDTVGYCIVGTLSSKTNLRASLMFGNNKKDNKTEILNPKIVINLAKKFILFLSLNEKLWGHNGRNYNNYPSVPEISYRQFPSSSRNYWQREGDWFSQPKLLLKDDANKISVISLGESYAIKTPLEEGQSIVLGSQDHGVCAVCASLGKDSTGKRYLIQWHFSPPLNTSPSHNGVLLKELFKKLLVDLHDIQVLVVANKFSTELPAKEELRSYWNAQSVNIFFDSDIISAIVSEEGVAWRSTVGPVGIQLLTSKKLIEDKKFHVVQWQGAANTLSLGSRLDAVNRSIEKEL